MAKYQDISITDATFTADVDLSSPNVQYFWVKSSSVAGNVQLATGASNGAALGILQNSPSAGQEARVRVLGFSKAYVVTSGTCNIPYGRHVSINTSGQTIPVGDLSSCVVTGKWLDATVPVSASRFGMIFIYQSPSVNGAS